MLLTTKVVSAAAVGLAFIASPLWRSEAAATYHNDTRPVKSASSGAPREIRVSRNAPMRNKVIRFASSRYDVKNTRAFVEIIWRESRFNHLAVNESSGAYGLGQANPGEKMAIVASDWKTNPYTQLAWVAKYIKERYGTPLMALHHHNREGWY